MTADIVALLVEIRRSGGDVRLVGRNRLKLVAPTALLPVLVERVRAAKPMLLAALADPASQVNIAQESGGGVSNPRRNSAAVQHPTAASTSDRADPTPTIKWRARHREALACHSVPQPGYGQLLIPHRASQHWVSVAAALTRPERRRRKSARGIEIAQTPCPRWLSRDGQAVCSRGKFPMRGVMRLLCVNFVDLSWC